MTHRRHQKDNSTVDAHHLRIEFTSSRIWSMSLITNGLACSKKYISHQVIGEASSWVIRGGACKSFSG